MPIPDDIRLAYRKKLEGSFKDVDDMSMVEIRRTIKFLEKLGKDIRAEMSVSKKYRADQLKKLKRDVDAHISSFKDELVKTVQQAQGKSYKAGGKSTDALPKAMNIDIALPALSVEQLQLAQNFTEDLAVQLTDEVRRKVSRAINEVALGVKKPIDAMDEVEKWVSPVKTPKGYVGSAYRAEMIVRTAVNRAFDMGARARAEQVEKEQPGLEKWWLTAGDERVRPTHWDAGIRYGENNPIPLNKPFMVGGTPLMYPGDPAGAPEEVINCRCRAIYVHPKWVSEVERREKLDKKKKVEKKEKEIKKKVVKKKKAGEKPTLKDVNEEMILRLSKRLGLDPDASLEEIQKQIDDFSMENPDPRRRLHSHVGSWSPTMMSSVLKELYEKEFEKVKGYMSEKELKKMKIVAPTKDELAAMKRYLDLQHLAMRKRFPDGKVKLYRAVSFPYKSEERLPAMEAFRDAETDPDVLTYHPRSMVESWTEDKSFAEKRVKDTSYGGYILEMEVPVGYIAGDWIDDPKAYGGFAESEKEYTMMSLFDELQIEKVTQQERKRGERPVYDVKAKIKGRERLKEAERKRYDINQGLEPFPEELEKARGLWKYLKEIGWLDKDLDYKQALKKHIEVLLSKELA